MKKILLSVALAFIGFSVNSQVVFKVEEPASIEGGYPLNYTVATQSWGGPDMLIPANAITDTVALAEDTSPTADSLMCLAATPGSLNGKIALLYRGTCGFGVKAKMAQNAGAIAVIVVNNQPGPPAGMNGGPEGLTVTIPVIMVSNETGALIKQQLKNGVVVKAFIGVKAGLYPVDLKTSIKHVMVTDFKSIPLTLAENSEEFPVGLGVYVFNDGSDLQSGVTVEAEIKKNGTSIYTETSAPFGFAALTDSIWVSDFPTPSIAEYGVGEYTVTYTINPATADGYFADNIITTKFNITNDMISLARLNQYGLPSVDGGSRPETPNGSFKHCIAFRNPNGSRMGAEGMYFGMLKNAADGAVTGEEVLLQAFKWLDEFDDLDDDNFSFDNLEEVANATYEYPGDYQDSTVYKQFDTPFVFEDNQRYLFCVTTNSVTAFLAYDTETTYDQLDLIDPQPRGPIQVGSAVTDWRVGFVGSPIPSLGVKAYVNYSGIADNKTVEANVYPNPAKEHVTVSIKGFTGDAHMTVTDVAGKTVINKTITTDANGNVKVNTAELNNGMYIFNLQMSNGTVSKFNVVINK